jgi:hypothetical protein
VPIEEFAQYIDFMIVPWFNCRIDSFISTQSEANVTLSLSRRYESDTIITSTSNEINVSTRLLANVPYTMRIKNTRNESVSIMMSTRISEPISQTAVSFGALFTIASLVSIVGWIKKEYGKRRDGINAKMNGKYHTYIRKIKVTTTSRA